MNRIQETIASVTGLDDVIVSLEAQHTELKETFESERTETINVMEDLLSANALLERRLEDVDYLNLFDTGQMTEILPLLDRKKTLARLRRLRHDNPLAKQAVKLIIRFTLGRGVQWILTAEKPTYGPPSPEEAPPEQQSTRGIVPIKYVDTTKQAKAAQEAFPFAAPPKPADPNVPEPTTTTSTSDTAGGPDVEADDIAQDPIFEILEDFWEDLDNQLAFTTHKSMQQMLDEIVTDGEKFYACFESNAAPYLKVSEIPIEEIVTIIYDPDNRLRPVYYRRQYIDLIYDGKNDMYKPSGQPITKYYLDYRVTPEQLTGTTDQPGLNSKIKIPASKLEKDVKIRHVMINDLQTKMGKRGVSELYASREWFRVFREFMEGRAAINAAAQAISYIRKVKGGPPAVASVTGKFGGLPVGDSAPGTTEIAKLTRPIPGALYDTNEAVDLSWMKTDTGAQNAKEDARLLLMSAGAGVGTFVHYFGEGGDANLATAQSMELPMVKSYEDWQQFIDDFYREWFKYTLILANGDVDQANEDIKRIEFTFPPIISQDVVKYTTSWAQIIRDIAPNNLTVRKQAIQSSLAIMGVPNIAAIMPQVELEMNHAEVQRQQQQQQMMDLAATAAANPPPSPFASNGKPPNGQKPDALPNGGMDPNMKHLVAGKGVKTSNGPNPS